MARWVGIGRFVPPGDALGANDGLPEISDCTMWDIPLDGQHHLRLILVDINGDVKREKILDGVKAESAQSVAI